MRPIRCRPALHRHTCAADAASRSRIALRRSEKHGRHCFGCGGPVTRRQSRATLTTARILVGACRAAFVPSAVVTRWVEPGTGLAFILVAPGQFLMGSPVEEAGREAQETQHAVALTRPFWLGEFEITQRQWKLVMGDNPSWFAQDDDMLPVENVTWFQIQEFLRRLTMRAAGNMFRLPTEAEWEY